MIPKNLAPTIVTGMDVAFVSGPRTVMVASPWYLDSTISHWLAAMELRVPGCSVCARQIRSTKGESDSLSSKLKIMFPHPIDQALRFLLLLLKCQKRITDLFCYLCAASQLVFEPICDELAGNVDVNLL